MSDRAETAYVRSNGQVTLPANVRRAVELAEGDAVEVAAQEDGTVVLRPIVVMDRLQADLLFRLGEPQPPDVDHLDVRERIRALVRDRHLPVATGRRLDALVQRYERGALTRKSFIGEAVILGLPASAIAAILTDPGRDQSRPAASLPESAPHGDPGGSGPPSAVRIAQAFPSLLYLPLYIAHDAGFFDDEGLSVTISTAGGGPEAWSAVESGLADYSVHDPVFAVRALEQGVEDACVVGTICNGQAISALARDAAIDVTQDPQTFITETVADRTVSTQPEPDSQWALLKFLRFLYSSHQSTYRNLQVPIGTEPRPVLDGQADICLAFPSQAEQAIADGLHEVFDFSQFFGPYLLSAIATRRSVLLHDPRAHQALLLALEKACQYAHAFPEEAVRIAQHEFPSTDPNVIAAATRRCLRRNFVPSHVAVDGEAWQENGVMNQFVGTIRHYRRIGEVVDNEAALHAYRVLGNLHMTWSEPRPVTGLVNAAAAVPAAESAARAATGPTR